MSKDELTTALGVEKVVGSEERLQLIGCSYIDGLSKLPLSSPLPGEVIVFADVGEIRSGFSRLLD